MTTLVRKFSVDNLKKESIDTGLTAAGFVAAHQISKLIKKDNLIVNGGMAAAGIAVAVLGNEPMVRAIGTGIAVFGIIKTANTLSKAEEPVKGLGALPEGIRKGLATAFPTLSGAEEEVSGYRGENKFRMDEPVELRSLPVNGIGTLFLNGNEAQEQAGMTGTNLLMAS